MHDPVMLLDTVLTYMIVFAAACFVVWRIFLPVRVKTILLHRLSGRREPCAPQAEATGCSVGCSGCALGSIHKQQQQERQA